MKTTLLKIFAIASIAALLAGCAILGYDVQGFRDIKEAHVKVFDKDIHSCYGLAAQALKKWGVTIFQQRKDDYIVAMEFEKVFRSCIDTTGLGIFFTQAGPNKTEVKVTSLNYSLSQFMSQQLFNYIEKDGKISKEEELKLSDPRSHSNPFKNK